MLHVVPGVVVLALGLAITDAPLTATAMNSAPARHSGIAAGLGTAVLAAGAVCAAGGLLAALTITNPPRVPRPAGVPAPEQCLHCGLDAPPLTTSAGQTAGPQ